MELRVTNTKSSSSAKQQNIAKNNKAKSEISKSSNIHKDHRSRLKHQFVENGIEKLTDIQKLELLLFYAIPQKDTNPIAHRLLNEFGSLSDVLCARHNELMKVDGVKENSATLIRLFGSMLNYSNRPVEDFIINASAKAKEYATKFFSHVYVEQFYVFCLTKSDSTTSIISSVNVCIWLDTLKPFDFK